MTLSGFGTRAIHVGSAPSEETGAVIPPISLATTYAQSAVGVHKGYEYTRSGNPNRDQLESLLASLEADGQYALAFSSGSATTSVVLQALDRDAHVLSVNDVYGGTFRYMTKVSGLEVSFLDMENADDTVLREAIRPNTKVSNPINPLFVPPLRILSCLMSYTPLSPALSQLIWIESPTNPTLRLISIPRIVSIARAHPSNPLVLVDNTFMSPYYASPLSSGADIVVHSLTKYINGHSDVLMGAAILPARHSDLAQRLRFLQNAMGCVPSAFDCWLAQRGAKTLHLRMRQHGLNALRVAQFLQSRVGKEVKDVIYPGLATHPLNDLAYQSLSPHARKWVDSLGDRNANGGFPYGGMVSFRIMQPTGISTPSSVESDETVPKAHSTAENFLQALRLFTLAESLGGVESLAELPSLMTHASIPPAERAQLGIGDDLVRLSCGVEDGDDLVQDIARGLSLAVNGFAADSKVEAVSAVTKVLEFVNDQKDAQVCVGDSCF